MIFDPQLFHHLNRPGPLDQWVKIFSFLVSFSPRYSNFSESSPSIKLRGVKFRTVSYCAESINKICSERSIILPGASLKLGDFLKFYCKALSIRSSESRHDSSWKVGGGSTLKEVGEGSVLYVKKTYSYRFYKTDLTSSTCMWKKEQGKKINYPLNFMKACMIFTIVFKMRTIVCMLFCPSQDPNSRSYHVQRHRQTCLGEFYNSHLVIYECESTSLSIAQTLISNPQFR